MSHNIITCLHQAVCSPSLDLTLPYQLIHGRSQHAVRAMLSSSLTNMSAVSIGNRIQKSFQGPTVIHSQNIVMVMRTVHIHLSFWYYLERPALSVGLPHSPKIQSCTFFLLEFTAQSFLHFLFPDSLNLSLQITKEITMECAGRQTQNMETTASAMPQYKKGKWIRSWKETSEYQSP